MDSSRACAALCSVQLQLHFTRLLLVPHGVGSPRWQKPYFAAIFSAIGIVQAAPGYPAGHRAMQVEYVHCTIQLRDIVVRERHEIACGETVVEVSDDTTVHAGAIRGLIAAVCAGDRRRPSTRRTALLGSPIPEVEASRSCSSRQVWAPPTGT